jgi:hypothetical protein
MPSGDWAMASVAESAVKTSAAASGRPILQAFSM